MMDDELWMMEGGVRCQIDFKDTTGVKLQFLSVPRFFFPAEMQAGHWALGAGRFTERLPATHNSTFRLSSVSCPRSTAFYFSLNLSCIPSQPTIQPPRSPTFNPKKWPIPTHLAAWCMMYLAWDCNCLLQAGRVRWFDPNFKARARPGPESASKSSLHSKCKVQSGKSCRSCPPTPNTLWTFTLYD